MPLKLVGDVLDVIEGRINASHLHTVIPAQFQFALGAGTFFDEYGIGETIVIEGQPYVSWVQNGRLITDTHALFKSPFLLGVDAARGKPYRIAKTEPLSQWYQKLAAEHPAGVAVAGKVLFAELCTTYIRKPPVFGENINEHHDEYWSNVELQREKWVHLFGVVVGKGMAGEVLNRAFYQNPGEKKGVAVQSHSHVALLGKADEVEGVRHLLTQSVVLEGTVELICLAPMV